MIMVAPGLFAEWKDIPTPPLFPFSVGFFQLIFNDQDSVLSFIELHKRARAFTWERQERSGTKKSSQMLFEIPGMLVGSPQTATRQTSVQCLKREMLQSSLQPAHHAEWRDGK